MLATLSLKMATLVNPKSHLRKLTLPYKPVVQNLLNSVLLKLKESKHVLNYRKQSVNFLAYFMNEV